MIDNRLREKIHARFPKGVFPAPFAKQFDLEFTLFEKGAAAAEVTVTDDWCNPFGHAHGGFLFTLLDEILGTGASSVLDEPVYADVKYMLTTNHEIYFHAPAVPGNKLVVSSSVISARKGIIFMEGQIRNKEDDQLIATSKGMWYIVR